MKQAETYFRGYFCISIFLILTETTRLPWPEPFQKLTKGLRYEFSRLIGINLPVGKRRFNMKMRAFDFRLTDSSRSAGILWQQHISC